MISMRSSIVLLENCFDDSFLQKSFYNNIPCNRLWKTMFAELIARDMHTRTNKNNSYSGKVLKLIASENQFCARAVC